MLKRSSQVFVPVILVILIASGALFVSPCFAQVATGTPRFGSFAAPKPKPPREVHAGDYNTLPNASPSGPSSGGPDVINLGNLNVHLPVPVIQKAGRGMPFTYDLTYDSSIWNPVTSGGTTSWQNATNTKWGWTTSLPIGGGYVSNTITTRQYGCSSPPYYWLQQIYSNYVYHDGLGTPHAFSGSVTVYVGCKQGNGTPFTRTALDDSGYTLSVDGTGAVTSLTASDGAIISGGTLTLQDRNGNQITSSTSSGTTSYYDTSSSTTPVLTVSGSGTPTSPMTYTYAAPSGGSASYTAKYAASTVKTNFGCSGISEFGPTSENLVSEIDLPDDNPNGARDRYTFTYEVTPGFSGDVTGRIASVTLPTGAIINYTYTGGSNGIECTDGSTAGLTRQTSDGTWSYSRSGSGTQWATTLDDPQGNQTVIHFQEATGSNYFYETQRQVSQLVNGTQTLLQTTNTCYNGSSSPCTSTAITLPISQIAETIQLAGSGNLESKHVANFNTYGLPTNSYDYDWASGTPPVIRQTLVTYASLGNNINAFQQSVTIEDGNNNVASQISYNYDETGVVASNGTPQHVSVSGSRGNLTSTVYTTQGSSTLKQTFTYFDTGNVDTATDVNSTNTTYNYPDATSTCGNAFPTKVVEAISTLYQTMTWNCTGGVETSVTDENGNTVSATYNDPYFWRPASTKDQEQNSTNYTYASPNSVENSLLFNGGNSTTDILVTLDGLGRTHVTQQKQSPSASNYDSVETDYDSLGRPSKVTVPYSGTAGQTGGSAPATTTTYDALSRPLVTTDGGNGTATLSYSANDILQTVGPAPTGENTKRRQSEYNSVGQLTSVCEVTSLTGSGACAQNTSATGYWTKYGYDGAGRLLTVTQNAQSAQAQTRSFTYDDLGRMTSEANPETGTIHYVYDSDATCGTSKGDLVKKTDAAGNVICYAYDALHRTTSITYPSGPNSSNTPSKYFIYDSATVNSVVMANAKARLAEAYTCVSPCSSKITDEGFSYTVRGEVSDEYESTPHSGGYYHAAATYWANGVLNALTGPGQYSNNYGLDGEGRVYSAGGGLALASTTYNSASQPTIVIFGSLDSDSFTYDPNTGRMTQYKYNVNSQSVTGALTWNANGTLGSLNITDPFNAANTQNCSYTHDDLVRIASGNCGSIWSQTFSYDAFGNITKTGSSQFQPTYSYATNQMSSIGSFTPTYDSNGDVLNDALHSYAWDADTRPTTIDTVTVTYDAFDRMVEHTKSGTSTEIEYSPTKFQMNLLNGQTAIKAFVPMPAGTEEVWQSGGASPYYRHSDWLGSSRFASTSTRTMYNDLAYAPFGEQYAQAGSTGVTDTSFAGNNEYTTTNLYDAQFREYGIQGRWPSPDPAGLKAADPRNPQSWNRYAYVLNNPLRGVDPLGLFCVWDDGSYDSASNHSDADTPGSVYSDVLNEYFVEPSDDPDTSSPKGCEDAGGTWFNGSPSDYGLTSDWSAQPNSSLAGFVSDWTDNQGGGYNSGYNGLVTQNDYTYFQQNGTTPNLPFLPALGQAGQIASPQNIFELWGSSVVVGACGPLWQQCVALAAVGTYTFDEIFGEGRGIGPPSIHVPSEGPTGQQGPEPPPISGPPVP